MKKIASMTVVMVCGVGMAVAFSDSGSRQIREFLLGVQEVPVVSTTGTGTFEAEISRDGQSISYTLTFANLEGDVRQSHIHIAPEQNTGNIVLWLCQTPTNPNPLVGNATPQCFDANNPLTLRSNTVTGVLTGADIAASAAANGVTTGELDEVIALIRAGKTYVNVHSAVFPPGEIRSQIEHSHGTDGH
jgi:hypothetical protein